MTLLEDLFLGTLRMSAGAALCIVAVLIVRLFLKKAPRVFSYALWVVVLLRLLCPFLPGVDWSPMPSAALFSPEGERSSYVQVRTGLQAVDGPVNEYLYQHPIPQRRVNAGKYGTGQPDSTHLSDPAGDSAPLTWVEVGSGVWAAGMLALGLYGVVALLRLRWKLREAVKLEGERDIWLADHIPTAFVLGGLFPRIYLPSDLPEDARDYVLRHERVHAGRGDHLIRIAAWAALIIHWFNPLVWLAFHLAGRDMETSCDEAVLKQYGGDVRPGYSSALLRLSGGRLPTGPLSFGTGDPARRIKHVLDWKRPAAGVLAAALAVVLCAGLALATGKPSPMPRTEEQRGIYFNAVVLEEHDAWLLAEVSGSHYLVPSPGSKVNVRTDALSPINYPGEVEVGDAIRVVFNGVVMESDPAQLGTVYAVYLLDENGQPVPNRGPGTEADPPAGLTYTYWPPIDAVEIGGLDCGQLTWYYPDDPAPEQVLLALQPRFLHPRLQGEDLAVSARWLDETGARLQVSFSYAGSGGISDPYTEAPAFTADLAAGTAAGAVLDHTFSGLPAFTEGELLDMAQTLAEIIRGAEEFCAAQN